MPGRLARLHRLGGRLRGVLARATAIARDRRAMEEALRRSQRRLTLALAATDEEIWDWEVGADRYYLGPRWAKVLGVSGGSGTGLYDLLRRFLHPDDLPPLTEEIGAHLSGRLATSEREVRVRTPEGELWVLIRGGRSEWDGAGAVRRMSGTLRDVTERRRREEQLSRREQMLEASERLALLGRLVAAMAHELNSPLAAIFANLDFAERALERGGRQVPRADPAEVRAALAEARVAQRRVAGLLRQLGAFAAAGERRREPVAIQKEIGMAVSLAEVDLGARLTVEARLGKVPDVRAASGELAQVMAHVLAHVAGAAAPDPAGPAPVTVSTRLDGGGRVLVEVQGRGRDGEDAAPAFDWFFRRERSDLSAGLGLAIGRAVIAALGGEIEVSEGGGMVTVRVLLPPAAPEG